MKQTVSNFDFLITASRSSSAQQLAWRLEMDIRTVQMRLMALRRRGIVVTFERDAMWPTKNHPPRVAKRELQAVELLGQGWSVEQVADHMTVEQETVEVYVDRHNRRLRRAAP